MRRMQTEQDPERAVAYGLAGLWDAVELLSHSLDDDGSEQRAALDALVRSLPARLACAHEDDLATEAVTEHLAEVVTLQADPAQPVDVVGRRRSGA